MKRLFDLIGSIFLLLILCVPMSLLYLLIRWRLGAPVLFKQNRLGKGEKVFKIYKFRTMTDTKDSSGNLLPDDVRLTPLGKLVRSLSLDELPQLLNIVKGEMSFIGPRALFAEYQSLYTDRERVRHSVRPGITGWAQVNGRNSITWKGKFEYDIYYVDHSSWLLDLKIVFLTLKAITSRQGVNQEEGLTMEKYDGTN